MIHDTHIDHFIKLVPISTPGPLKFDPIYFQPPAYYNNMTSLLTGIAHSIVIVLIMFSCISYILSEIQPFHRIFILSMLL